MKGVILAGGTGSRLYPSTVCVCKQLLPVYDKPMIYYPISTLILAGISEILIIVSPRDLASFQKLLSGGSQFGIEISYTVQENPTGLPDGLLLASDFVGDEDFLFILGDNLFHGPAFGLNLKITLANHSGPTIFPYRVANPSAYGVVTFNELGKIVNLEEKPVQAGSKWAIPGLYKLTRKSICFANTLQPSKRGETEIIDLLKAHLDSGDLSVEPLSRGNAWLDLGTPESLLSAAHFVQTTQARQGLLIGSPEESALRAGMLSRDAYEEWAQLLPSGDYKNTLLEVLY